jgi:hypothetical protein
MTGPAFSSLLRSRLVSAVAISAALCGWGCAWQPYVVTRSIREVTGAKLRLHVIAPLGASLSRYRLIEVRPLDDLLGTRVPADIEQYFTEHLVQALHRLPSSPTVVTAVSNQLGDGSVEPPAAVPTLVVDGFIDDYDPGSRALRVAELGFNHIAVTVRVRLRDQQTGRLLSAASLTAEDDRASGTTKAAINHLTDRIRDLLAAGYAM